jgi:PAS domain S-box-containing protein
MTDSDGMRRGESEKPHGRQAGRAQEVGPDIVATSDAAEPEALLRELEPFAAELAATVASIADGVVVFGADGKRRFANRAANEIMRYTAEEHATADLSERVRLLAFLAEDGSPIAADQTPIAKALRGEASKRVVVRVPRAGGDVWVSISASPIRGAGGEITGAVSTLRDITQNRQMQERVAWLASFPERNPLPITEVSLAGQLHYINPSARRLFPDLEERCLEHAWLADWQTAMGELRAQEGLVWERVVPVGDEHYQQSLHLLPEVGRVRIYGRNVSARIRMERALREADQRKNEFLGMLSHELRNPLAPIRNSLHILARAAPDSETARRAHAVIERQTAHMTRLVDDLLDATRISRGKIQLRRAVLDLGDLVRHSAEDLRALFVEAGIDLALELAAEPLWVDGDATRLTQSLGNLLHNSLKFTNRGGKVRVSLVREGQDALLRVRDTGAGMDPETMQSLFEPFAQAERTLDRSRGGLGLGLALVKALVALHGGQVSAHSDGLNQGATFAVRLPLASAPPAAARRPAGPPARPARRRVLVIEDNVDAALSLREVLEIGGHEAVVAYHGHEGLAKARELRPDVILCDIGLPGLDGYQVARALRTDEELANVFLVALTGYARAEDLERAMAAGFDRHIAKPPSLEELEELLEQGPRTQAG